MKRIILIGSLLIPNVAYAINIDNHTDAEVCQALNDTTTQSGWDECLRWVAQMRVVRQERLKQKRMEAIEDMGTALLSNSPPSYPSPPLNCQSYRFGNTVNTTCN